MNNTLYVGGLSLFTTNLSLEKSFIVAGRVQRAVVITDRVTGRSKGFGFVEMTTANEAAEAVLQLNDLQLEGHKITVSLAKERRKCGTRLSY